MADPQVPHPAVEHPAVEVARSFLEAIVWGQHLTVWELLSSAGRDVVLEAGARRGLDAVQAARLRQGTSPTEEQDKFLTGLVHGLRVDFSSVELEKVVPLSDVVELAEGRYEVTLECPASFGEGGWAAGSMEISEQRRADGVTRWLVDRINPLVSRSE
ncbi:MAG: hypothetical protein ACRBK7_18945 [Acidimicrobiales bacterium]